MLNKIKVILTEGYKVASGQSKNSIFPNGSIYLQKKFFQNDIDFSNFFLGTLNFSIYPYQFEIKNPDFSFFDIEWFENEKENFFFVKCEIEFNSRFYKGYIYYPFSSNIDKHPHDNSTFEVISEFIKDISYGDKAYLTFDDNEIFLTKK